MICLELSDFLKKYHLPLNEQQRQAVARTTGQTLLLAVPGSGKTTVSISRLGYLIFGCGVAPSSVLTVSYNVSAVNDLKARFAAVFGPQDGREQPEFRTIHGFCAKVLEMYSRMTGRPLFRLMDEEGESAALVRDVFCRLVGFSPDASKLSEILTQLSILRNLDPEDGEFPPELTMGTDIRLLHRACQAEKARRRVMDYDDQLFFAYRALQTHPRLRAYFQQKYPHIQVDEAQDVSHLQHCILRLLAENAQSLLLVGDEDQSIYAFRAAHPQALFEFRSIYPDGAVLTISQNYRSTGAIIQGALRLIRHNRDRYDKQMFSTHPHGDRIRQIRLSTRRAQYPWLLREAAAAEMQTAILFRNNDTALPLMDLLTKAGVPFFCRARDDTYLAHPNVVALCDGLRLAHSPHDTDLLVRLLKRMDIAVSDVAMQHVLRLHRPDGPTPLELLIRAEAGSPHTLPKMIKFQRALNRAARMNTRNALHRLRMDTALGLNVHRMDLQATRFDTLMLLAEMYPVPDDFFRALERLRQTAADGSGTPDARIVLSTIHSAKGLEFDHVILADLLDDILPTRPKAFLYSQEEKKRLLEEERRLCYVGVTRARKRLTVLTYRGLRSRFVREIKGWR
ncbi:MAG: ATP-dependent helicase [Clostridia bacterium]|nr:ATP-dependent helicase [Clostridia bacterium]